MPKTTLEEFLKKLDNAVSSGKLTPEEAEQEYFDRMEWDYGMFLS